ncbi:MAG: hypothetical protein QFF03_11325 [Pseudomonadota bacterium]|nr:hypothetical protein [Pseudomonadota bacterium]
MNGRRHASAALMLLLLGAAAAAQAPDAGWVSYRDAYRAMVVFEKYGQPKHLIQSHFQVMPLEQGGSTDGLRLTLAGKSMRLNLPLDATGRALLPLLKAAYDENAVLLLDGQVRGQLSGQLSGQLRGQLSGQLSGKLSRYQLRARVSVLVRADGVYEAAELRAACDQALNFARYADASARSLTCAGVRFGFAGQRAAVVRVRDGGAAQALPVAEGTIFADDPQDRFKTVLVRFADTPARGQVLTPEAPLAIAPVFE